MKDISLKFNSLSCYLGMDNRFGGMLILSLVLHAAAFICLSTRQHGGFGKSVVAYMDLDMATPGQSAAAKPVVTAKAEVPPEPSPAQPVSELDRLRENTGKTLNRAAARPEEVQKGSLGLGITSGYFASIGEGESLRDDIREYYFEMLRRINEKWWLNSGSREKGNKSAVFYLVIARNGTIIDRMMVESSGNAACDRAMLHALEAASPLPPLPDTYRGEVFQAPLRFNMPLNLLG